MPRTRRQAQIVVSDDEEGNDAHEPRTPSPRSKREAHRARTRASRGGSITTGVNALEISTQAIAGTAVAAASEEEEDEHEDAAMAQENTTPQKSMDEADTVLMTPMMASTPMHKNPLAAGAAVPRLQVAHLEPLAPTRKTFNDGLMNPPPQLKTNLHLPPPKVSMQPGDITSTQFSNDGLVAVSPSKGRLRSLAAEQAFNEKDLPPRPRLVISKLALTNFKSYAGRQEIGPFHSVRLTPPVIADSC